MTTLTHIAVSYLVSFLLPVSHRTKFYALLLIIAGNIFDIDILLALILGLPTFAHHVLATHTPLAGLVYLFLFYVLFKNKLSKRQYLFLGFSMLLHLIMDDLSYWLSQFGLLDVRPQIMWLYPFDNRRAVELIYWQNVYNQTSEYGQNIVLRYLSKASFLIFFELFLCLWAMLKFTNNKKQNYASLNS